MKHILITGVNSYIGNSLAEWLKKTSDIYVIEKLSLKDDSWTEKDFSKYDVVVHVAGIAHVSKDKKMEEKYYRVNCDLTTEVAKKSKADSVDQFIFMSSIIVYGDAPGKRGLIDENTIPSPRDFYGDSKLQAENSILPLNDENFQVAVIRPPMIYGKGSKGNYPKLAKAAQKLPVFPDFANKRSMLHIDNLCEFLRLMIDNKEHGLFFPQNKESVKTSDMVRVISEVHGKSITLIKWFNPILRLMLHRVGIVNKVFSNLIYTQDLSYYKLNYNVKSFQESIVATER